MLRQIDLVDGARAALSRLILVTILSEVLSEINFYVDRDDTYREQLHNELLDYFGLVGGLDICEALEAA